MCPLCHLPSAIRFLAGSPLRRLVPAPGGPETKWHRFPIPSLSVPFFHHIQLTYLQHVTTINPQNVTPQPPRFPVPKVPFLTLSQPCWRGFFRIYLIQEFGFVSDFEFRISVSVPCLFVSLGVHSWLKGIHQLNPTQSK